MKDISIIRINMGVTLKSTYIANVILLDRTIGKYRLGNLVTYDLLKEPFPEDTIYRLAFMELHLEYTRYSMEFCERDITYTHDDMVKMVKESYIEELTMLGNKEDKTGEELLREEILTIAVDIEYIEKYANVNIFYNYILKS